MAGPPKAKRWRDANTQFVNCLEVTVAVNGDAAEPLGNAFW